MFLKYALKTVVDRLPVVTCIFVNSTSKSLLVQKLNHSSAAILILRLQTLPEAFRVLLCQVCGLREISAKALRQCEDWLKGYSRISKQVTVAAQEIIYQINSIEDCSL